MSESETSSRHVVTVLEAVKEVQVSEVTATLQTLWAEIREDPAAKRAALDAGLDEHALRSPEPPFAAGRGQSEIGVGEAIVIFVAAETAKNVIKRTVDAAWQSKVWQECFWPRIRQRFGVKLKPRK